MNVINYSKCDFINHINDILNECAKDSKRFSDDIIIISSYDNILNLTEKMKEQRLLVDVQDFIIDECVAVLVIAQDIRTGYIEPPCFSNGSVKDFVPYYVFGDNRVVSYDSEVFYKNRYRHGCLGGEIFNA